jgi:Xaa-Pro aminopeptidase
MTSLNMDIFDYEDRINQLCKLFDILKIDGMLIHSQESIRYFAGFTGSHGWLIISENHRILFTDPRYSEQAANEAPKWNVECCGIDRFQDLIRTIENSGLKRLGFEAEELLVSEYNEMSSVLNNTDLIASTNIGVSLRMIKEPLEINYIKASLDIAESSFLNLSKEIRPGMSEHDIANQLDYLMRKNGSEGSAFNTIVAAGINSSNPHHSPGKSRISENDFILLDFGAQLGGYKSDITRMIFINKIPDEVKSLKAATEEALMETENVLKPGMNGAEADEVARAIFRRENLEHHTLRGLGHGVGLAIHEWPRLVMKSDTILRPGMICTLEPGVYIPNTGGIRMEDMILVTENGIQVLNKTPWSHTVNPS